MARPRVIDQDAVLDAAEMVVGRAGAAHMTLDAVAAEAGISKASVIYDYKSKQNLIKAVIERKVKEEEDRIRVAVRQVGARSEAEMIGRIDAASTVPDDETRAVALNLSSALAQDSELRRDLQGFYERQVAAVTETTERPHMALLAFLALEGLKMLEYFDFYHWAKPEREAILKDMVALLKTDLAEKPAGGRALAAHS